jgi:hypothetical protein
MFRNDTWAEDMAEVIRVLPSKLKNLTSNPNIAKNLSPLK